MPARSPVKTAVNPKLLNGAGTHCGPSSLSHHATPHYWKLLSIRPCPGLFPSPPTHRSTRAHVLIPAPRLAQRARGSSCSAAVPPAAPDQPPCKVLLFFGPQCLLHIVLCSGRLQDPAHKMAFLSHSRQDSSAWLRGTVHVPSSSAPYPTLPSGMHTLHCPSSVTALCPTHPPL
jgi:hypothetical protein